MRLRFLVALLAVIVVSETVIVVTFYNQRRQHSINDRLVGLAEQMHDLSDFQFGAAQIALQRAPVAARELGELRSELAAFAKAAAHGSREHRLALRRLSPEFDSLARARARLERLPRAARGREAERRRLFERATALIATTAVLHHHADARIRSAQAVAEARERDALRTLIVGSTISLLAAIALALFLARTISRPVAQLAAGARELGAGRLGHRLAVGSRDEIGTVAEEFNRMAAQLEEARSTLERRVDERTRELAEANRQLERHRAAQERLAHQRRSLLKRLITVQEEERRRIARELHDEAGQSLTGLRLGLEAAEADLSAGRPEESARRLKSLAGIAADAITDLDRLVLDLRPAQLDTLGLVAALRWYAARLESQTGIATAVDVRGGTRRLEPEVETALFRIAQEALTNVARHARASQVDVVLEFAPRSVSLEIGDDGVGFDSESAGVSSASVGLLGMREHAELVGGTLVVRSRLGEGTQVIATVMLEGTLP